MSILAIDPGNEQSAYVLFANGEIFERGKLPNDRMRQYVRNCIGAVDRVVIEMIASYGMPVGAEVFETCLWIGRFIEAWENEGAEPTHSLLFRRDVKLHLCGSPRAKDGNIRQALIDRFGPGREKAIGTKRAPGPLYGVTADVWAALAVAVTYADRRAP